MKNFSDHWLHNHDVAHKHKVNLDFNCPHCGQTVYETFFPIDEYNPESFSYYFCGCANISFSEPQKMTKKRWLELYPQSREEMEPLDFNCPVCNQPVYGTMMWADLYHFDCGCGYINTENAIMTPERWAKTTKHKLED
jgi:hypothetical protein